MYQASRRGLICCNEVLNIYLAIVALARVGSGRQRTVYKVTSLHLYEGHMDWRIDRDYDIQYSEQETRKTIQSGGLRVPSFAIAGIYLNVLQV